MKRIWLIVATLGASVGIGSNQVPAAETVVIDLTQWTPPDITKVGEDPFGELVKYGHALFTDTPNEIGPDVSDAAKRFAGNNLACQNCLASNRPGGTGQHRPIAGAWIGRKRAMPLRSRQAPLASASDSLRKRPVMLFPAVHESALRQFVATHQIGRYCTQSGHIESRLVAIEEAIAVQV